MIARQFDEMDDEYLRERKADLEQVVERILRYMKGVASPVAPRGPAAQDAAEDLPVGRHGGRAARAGGDDLSPAEHAQLRCCR